MKQYAVKVRAYKNFETAVGQEVIATFELTAKDEIAASFRAQTMMRYIMMGYIRDKDLSEGFMDAGCVVVEVKEA